MMYLGFSGEKWAVAVLAGKLVLQKAADPSKWDF
jgi:hypothetical protein